MNFEEAYEEGVNMYKQRLREIMNLRVRQEGDRSITYDRDRVVYNLGDYLRPQWEEIVNAPRDIFENLVEETNNPNMIRMVRRNTKIYDIYQKAIDKRKAEIESIREGLEGMKAQSTKAIINPGGEVQLARMNVSNIRPNVGTFSMLEEMGVLGVRRN